MLLSAAALTAGSLLGCFRSSETTKGGGGGSNNLPGNPKGSFYGDDAGPPALVLRDASAAPADAGAPSDARAAGDAKSIVIPAVTVSVTPTVTPRLPGNPKGSHYNDPLDDRR